MHGDESYVGESGGLQRKVPHAKLLFLKRNMLVGGRSLLLHDTHQ